MKYAQILYGKAHWVFEADEKPEFAPNIILVDITGRDDIQEGWDYDNETQKFSPPPPNTQQGPELKPSIEEEILIETRYQTMLIEMTSLGGM